MFALAAALEGALALHHQQRGHAHTHAVIFNFEFTLHCDLLLHQHGIHPLDTVWFWFSPFCLIRDLVFKLYCDRYIFMLSGVYNSFIFNLLIAENELDFIDFVQQILKNMTTWVYLH